MKKTFLFIFLFIFCFSFIACKEVEVEKEIKVTIQDSNGNVMDTVMLSKDVTIDLNSYNGEYFYYQWDKTIDEILNSKEDIIVTGTYNEYKKKHIFIINEIVVYETELSFYEEPNKPNAPIYVDSYEWKIDEKKDGNIYVYTYTMEYKTKMFTVKFLDENENVIDEQTVEYGKAATEPELETEVKWNQDFSCITSDLIVTGSFLKKECNIEFYDGNTLLDLGMYSYKVGEVTVLPKAEKEGYEFIGWFASSISLYRYVSINEDTYGDLKLYARYIATEVETEFVLPESTCKLVGIDKIPHSSGNGTFVYQPVLPSDAPSQSKGAYNWSSSDESVATISVYSSITGKKAGFTVITGTLQSDPSVTVNGVIKVSSEGVQFSSVEEANSIELVTVTFVGKDDELIDTQTIVKGGSVYYPTPIEYKGLAFKGWDKQNYNILTDTTIKATYVEGTNNYVGKKFAIIGDSISTYQDYIPEGYACFYPYPTADVNDVNQTWWMQVVNSLGAGLFINNSYSGSCVGTTGTSSSQHDARLKELVINGQVPDVIIIYMGSNDCASKYVSDSAFDNGYRVMLDKIKVLCPDAEIILCNLPESKLYTEENRVIYNDIIAKYAKEYDLKLINLKNESIVDYLVDSAHPKKSGMSVIAKRILKEILK